jgi:hypothetical protein
MLRRGTPHAKLERIEGLTKVGFKPKEKNSLVIEGREGGVEVLRNHEIGEWGK